MSDSTKAVFLSYAHEDAPAARRIAEALRAFGVEVWFDQNELRGGDSWDAKIRTQIKTCALFVPVVSQQTQERTEGYFRREWKLAVDRTHDMAGGVAYLVPVVIDATPEGEAAVPEEFMRYQWMRLPAGEPTPDFVTQIKSLLESPRKNIGRDARVSPPAASVGMDAGRGLRTPVGPARGLSSVERPPFGAEAGYGDPALQKQQKRFPVWVVGAVAAVAIGVVAAVLFGRKPAVPRVATPAASSPVLSPPASSLSPAAAAAATDKSIAVLPFTNMSPDKENEYFSDGVHEDILTNLALIRELRVVSRTSVLQYRGATKAISQIAGELGVAYILEGSVRRMGSKVRVTAQLIRAATDEHLWAKNYDRDMTDVFSIQTELAREIAGALKAALSPEEQQLISRRPTENLAAYDAYVKARQIRSGGSGLPFEYEPILQTAVMLDPDFAQAWAELGSMHAQMYFNDFDHSPERLAKARSAIETAVRLAPDDPAVIEKLGDYHYYGYRDYARAAEQYRRLAVLRPNDAAVFGSLGFIHRRQGRWGEALTELRRAVLLEQRNLRYTRTLAQLTVALRLFDEAARVQKQIVANYPDQLLDAWQLAALPFSARGSTRELEEWMKALKPAPKDEALVVELRKFTAGLTGDLETGIRLYRAQPYFEGFNEPHWSQDISFAMALLIAGDTAAAQRLAGPAIGEGRAELERKPSPTTWVKLSAAHVVMGDKAEALRCARAAMELVPEEMDAVTGPTLRLNYAQILAWCGEKDRALAELARSLRTPFGENVHLARGPAWTPLHGDPRFEALLNDPENNAPLF